MKAIHLLITIVLFVSLNGNVIAQQKNMSPPKNKEAQQQFERMKEQQRLQRPLSEEAVKEIISFFNNFDPEFEKEMELIKIRDPKHYQFRLQHMEKEMRFLRRLQEEEPQRFEQAIVLRKLEVQCNKLARQYRKSNDDIVKGKMKNELRDKLKQLFELKEQEKKLEISRIRDRIEKMRVEMEERKANKEQIIKMRLNELTGKAHLSSW